MPNIAWIIIVGIVILIIWRVLSPKVYKKTRQTGEENTLKLIKQFIKWKGWKKDDYLLVSNLILQKENYWSCEIDILLMTKKWIYIVEIKDWKRGKLSGKLNDECLELSYKIGRKGKYQSRQMYSPFHQNDQHVKRFKNYFQLANNRNILSLICFNSPYLQLNLKKNKTSIFESKHLWVKNGQKKNISNLLAYCEKQNTQLLLFKLLKEKISKEVLIANPNKLRKHQDWVKSLKEKREN